MKYSIFVAVAAIALSGCGQQQEAARESNAQGSVEDASAATSYTGTGKVTAIAGNQVTIAHGPIEEIGWPAMTMTFASPRGITEGVAVGSDVSFAFRQDGSAYVLTNLQKR